MTRPALRRLLWAIEELRASRPLTATALARKFEVSVRTAYRDLDFLRDEWRVPVDFDPRERTYALTGPIGALPTVTLSEGELIALYFAEKVLAQYRGTPFEPDLESAFRKIQELLPHLVPVSPELVQDYLSFDAGALHTPDADVFRTLLRAWQQRRRVRVRYRSLNANRTASRNLAPYHVANHRGDWYVAAHDPNHEDVRLFALHRCLSAELTDEAYEVPGDFSYERFMSGAFGMMRGGAPREVAIRFAARQGRWIRERKWHRTARVEVQADGDVILRMRVAETSGVRRWLMQFGSEAEVLEPEDLRREVARDLSRALAQYRPARRGDELARPRNAGGLPPFEA
ncbi:MAG: WYL domain-containing protein [Vicinamibacteria bacterium]|nr:WYL domain-containing protein [Vicinamibacteria bacterium]